MFSAKRVMDSIIPVSSLRAFSWSAADYYELLLLDAGEAIS